MRHRPSPAGVVVGVGGRVAGGLLLVALLLVGLLLVGCASETSTSSPPALECQREGIDREACERGQEVFAREFTPSTGLGDQHNGGSCIGCHFSPIAGGEGSHAERVYSTDTRYDGPSERSFPAAQPFHTSPALWWVADADVLTEAEIIAGCGVEPELGIRGLAAVKEKGIGRFGRHGLALSVHAFNAGAFKHELGGCAPYDPSEHSDCVDGQAPIVTSAEFEDLTAYVLGLAAPAPAPMTPQERARGEALFGLAGCSVCHSPARPFRSDLCLHDMGRENTDDQEQGSRWRTAPLVGVRFLSAFGHDGRAAGVEEAIELLHAGGEGRESLRRFRELSSSSRAALVQFVEGL